jgi:hypothetical protein
MSSGKTKGGTMSKMEAELLETQYDGTFGDDSHSDIAYKHIEYDPNGSPNSERAIEQAQNENLDVKFPKANELFIDLDNDISFALFKKQMDILKKYVGILQQHKYPWDYAVTASRHGLPGRHIVVVLKSDVTEVERVALQAAMGSDRVRELLGYVQAKNNDPHPTLFLENKPLEQKLLTEGTE